MNAEPDPNRADRRIPLSAKDLQALVERLYPEPGVVDILTLDQFIFRYKFSGLGATAVADMERAQRITRTIGDHGQIGLAEFHIGLIYLHWGQFLGAIKYFDDAHRHWQFAKHDPAVSLAQFAQGVCQHHAYHYENALTNYGKVQRTLTKIRANGAAPSTAFLTELKTNLDKCREDVVNKIRTLGEKDPAEFHVPLAEADVAPAAATDDQPTRETAVFDPTVPPPPAADTTARLSSAPLPISNLPSAIDSDAQTDQETMIDETDAANLAVLDQSPILSYANQSDDLVWYNVVDRKELEDFLPNIQADTALLIDTHTDRYTYDEGDLVIVNPAEAEGSILLEPQQEAEERPFTRIYLAEVDEQFSFNRNPETGSIQFTSDKIEEIDAQHASKVKITPNPAEYPIYAEDIIGIVIGIWSKLHPAQK